MFNKHRWNAKKKCYEANGGKKSTISLFDLLIWTRDNGYFEAYSMNDVLVLPSNLYTCIKEDITNLNYNEDCSLREIKAKIEGKLKKFAKREQNQLANSIMLILKLQHKDSINHIVAVIVLEMMTKFIQFMERTVLGNSCRQWKITP